MSEPVPAPNRRRRTLLVVLCVLVVLSGVGVAWWLNDLSASQLLRKGLTAAPRDPALGEKWLRKAIAKAGGRFPDGEISLARLLAKRGAWTEALALFAALDKTACRADLLLTFGRDLLPGEHRTEGLAALEAVAQRGGREGIEALELLVANYQDWGVQDELVAAAARLTQLEPENPKRWVQLIEMLKGMVRDADCLNAIRQAQQQNLPVDFRQELQHRLVQQLIVEGDMAAVRSALDEMRKGEGNTVRVRAHEVVLLRLEGDQDQALKLLTALAPEVPDRIFVYFTRGTLHYDLGHFAEAVEDLKKVVEARPYDSPAQFKLSEAYRNLGQDDLARKHRQLSSEIADKRKRINALFRQRAAYPLNPQTYDELAQLHRELGEREAAQKWQHWLPQHYGAAQK